MQRLLVSSQARSHSHDYPSSGILKQRTPHVCTHATDGVRDLAVYGTYRQSHLGFTDSRLLNILAQLDLETAAYYAQKELLVQRR